MLASLCMASYSEDQQPSLFARLYSKLYPEQKSPEQEKPGQKYPTTGLFFKEKESLGLKEQLTAEYTLITGDNKVVKLPLGILNESSYLMKLLNLAQKGVFFPEKIRTVREIKVDEPSSYVYPLITLMREQAVLKTKGKNFTENQIINFLKTAINQNSTLKQIIRDNNRFDILLAARKWELRYIERALGQLLYCP